MDCEKNIPREKNIPQCLGRMTRKKYKIHGRIVYSEKRCSFKATSEFHTLCARCLSRPEGPTRHGNQEGYQVSQGQIDREYPVWSAIFGSPRYKDLVEEFGDPDPYIQKELLTHQREAREGIKWLGMDFYEIPKYASHLEERRSVTLTKYMPPSHKKIKDKVGPAVPTKASGSSSESDTCKKSMVLDLKSFIRPVQYYASSRTPYIVQEVVYISREELGRIMNEDGVKFTRTE